MFMSSIRRLMAILLGLSLTIGGVAPGLPDRHSSPSALAIDASVPACDESTFDLKLAAVQASGGGAIIFDCSGTIVFTAEKTITSDVKIVGNGSVIFDGANNTRLFRINGGGSLELINVTLQNAGGSSLLPGGAISNAGNLTIIASRLIDNVAGVGSAIFNDHGIVTLSTSEISSNESTATGAIFNWGSIRVSGTTFANNTASPIATTGGRRDRQPGFSDDRCQHLRRKHRGVGWRNPQSRADDNIREHIHRQQSLPCRCDQPFLQSQYPRYRNDDHWKHLRWQHGDWP